MREDVVINCLLKPLLKHIWFHIAFSLLILYFFVFSSLKTPEEWPPKSEREWRDLAKIERVSDKTIHRMDLDSASKFKLDQYLMLRVIWSRKTFGLAEWVEKASKELEDYSSWKSYRASFMKNGDPKDPKLPEGSFALARFNQKQVSRVPENAPFTSDVDASPISNRTRGHQKALNRESGHMTLETPSKAPKNPPKTPRTPPLNRYSDFYGEDFMNEDEGDTPEVPDSLGPPELLDEAFPKTKDEQIVNTALDFLNAFIMHRDSLVQWTLYRKPFTAEFTKAKVEARTDGCLEEVQSQNVHAIIEVKPVIRLKARLRIPMQEAAQMVAWIKTDPDPKHTTHSCGRRLHVSQDRHEIYIIFAEYKENYIKYLNGELSPADNPGFMTMHQFGPWNTDKRADMEDLGKILLAISLRAEVALKKKQAGR